MPAVVTGSVALVGKYGFLGGKKSLIVLIVISFAALIVSHIVLHFGFFGGVNFTIPAILLVLYFGLLAVVYRHNHAS